MDTLKKATPRLAEIFADYPELTELKKLNDKVMRNIDHPVVLSEIAVHMAGYMVRVGSLLSKLSAGANESYVMRKWRYLGEFHKMEGVVDERKAKAMDSTIQEYENELINKYLYDIIKAYHDDFDRIVVVIQSRLKVLQSERIHGGT